MTTSLDMTDQQVFDSVYEHMVKQGKRSVSVVDGECMYRGPDGLKCAVGALIPDDIYEPEMDQPTSAIGTSFYSINYRFPKIEEFFKDINPDLLSGLQNIHDLDESWNEMYFIGHFKMKNLAIKHDLEFKRIEPA